MSPGRSSPRRGATVVETVTALVLTLGLVSLASGLAVQVRRVGENVVRRTEVVEARRVTRDLLDLAVAGGGGRETPGAELQLRLFVGWARPCAGGGWHYRGRRRPHAQRDSLWAVSATGGVVVAALKSVREGGCETPTPGDHSLVLEADSAVAAPVLLRIFESGRFRLDDALRYGGTGDPAQPLTGAVLDPGVSGIEVDGGWVAATLRAEGDSAVIRRRWSLR